MTTNETRDTDPGASTDDQPTTKADSESVETVHRANGWRLTVRDDGSVETHEMGATRLSPFTTRDEWFGMKGENYRCGKTIEGVLARYAHETRFERDPNDGEHGAALRRGIIGALQRQCDPGTVPCDKPNCEGGATHVAHTNAPTNADTKLVCDDHADSARGVYVTLHPLDPSEDA